MEYVKLSTNVDGEVGFIDHMEEMPVWYRGDNTDPANLLTQEDLLTMDIYPVDDNLPVYDEFYQMLTEKPLDDWIFDSTAQMVLKTYAIETLSYEEKKNNMINDLAAIRYEHEIQGVMSPEGLVSTDRSSQAMLNSALQVVRDDPSKTIRWKCENNWILLDSTSIEQLSILVINHVEDCFDNEFVLWTAINDSTDMDDLKLVDINSGWPVVSG